MGLGRRVQAHRGIRNGDCSMKPLRPTRKGNAYRFAARSRTALIHAASFSPFRAAAALYASLRAAESLISSRSSSPSPMGGLPGSRFGASMPEVYVRTKLLTSGNQWRNMYVHY